MEISINRIFILNHPKKHYTKNRYNRITISYKNIKKNNLIIKLLLFLHRTSLIMTNLNRKGNYYMFKLTQGALRFRRTDPNYRKALLFKNR